MKGFKSLTVVAIMAAVILMVASAWAFNAEEHVSIAPNGKGDALIVPQFIALVGWDTKLTVINTCDKMSVVAKVVVRSGGNTKELLDFFIYLSPTDVWTGTLGYRDNGTGPRMYSEDDSVVMNSAGDFASSTNPFDVDLVGVCPGDVTFYLPGNNLGYLTVVEAWWFGGEYDLPDPWDKLINYGSAPVEKEYIKAAFELDCESEGTVAPLGFAETANVLACNYEISCPMANLTAANRATVLQNHNTKQCLSLGDESFLGGTTSRNSICEVEAALSKNRIAMPYYSHNSPYITLHFMNFPTKYTQVTSCTRDGVLSPFFEQNSEKDWCLEYGLKYFDLSENSTSTSNFVSPVDPEDEYFLCHEVNINEAVFSFLYDEGWANYQFDDTTSCDARDGVTEIEYDGAPVIPTIMFIRAGGMSLFGGAWSDGDVDVEGVWDPLYHYDRTADGGRGNYCEKVD